MPADPDRATIRRRRLLKGLAGAGVSVSLAGCGSNGDGEGYELGPGDRSYISASTSSAQGLNPVRVGDEATGERLDLLYDTGGTVDDDVTFQGRLMSSWSLSGDATSVTYELRDGLEWGAGYGQLTAEDYLYSIRNVFTAPWAGYSQRPFFFLGGEPIEYEQTGKLSFEATLPQQRPNWLHEDPVTSAWPLPKALIETYEPTDGGEGDMEGLGRDEAITSGDLNGNLGPFNLESWEKGQRMVLSRNEEYYLADTDVDDGRYRGSPNLESYEVQVFDERTTGYSAIKAGDITSISVEARKVSELDGASGVNAYTSKFGDGLFWLNLNFRANGWDQLRNRPVRQAMAHLFDKETLVREIFNGNANPIDTYHPRWGPYHDDEKITTFETSTEKARTKLQEGTASGYGYDDSDRFVGPEGEQVELTMVIDNTSQQGEIVANFMRQQLESVGIAMELEGQPFNGLVSNYLQNSVANNPDYEGDPDYTAGRYNGGPPDQSVSKEQWDLLYGAGFSASPYAPWQPIEATLLPQGSFNSTGYQTDEYDIAGAITEAPRADSTEETQEILTDLFGFLSRDQPYVWSFNDHLTAAYREGVENLPEPETFFDRPSVRLLSLATAGTPTPSPAGNSSSVGSGGQ
jgi:peptide/nickel transport system substrate-binding protein